MIIADEYSVNQQPVVDNRKLRKFHSAEKRDLSIINIRCVAAKNERGTRGIDNSFPYGSVVAIPVIIPGEDCTIEEICPQVCVYSKICFHNRRSYLTGK